MAQTSYRSSQQSRKTSSQRYASAQAEQSQKSLRMPTRDYNVALPKPISYNSLLLHVVPSPSLELEEEMSQAWLRSSQKHSPASESYCSCETYRDSSATLLEFADWVSQQTTKQSRKHRRPRKAWEVSNDSSNIVNSRLSLECSEPSTIADSNVMKKRCTTPTKLSLINTEPEDFTRSQRSWSESSIQSTTPVPSLCHSPSFCSTTEDSLSSICSVESPSRARNITQLQKRSQLTKTNQTLPPPKLDIKMPNSSTQDVLSKSIVQTIRPSTGESLVDPFYLPTCVIPKNSQVVEEVSFIDWDDEEDEHSKLTRVKQSITKLGTTRNKVNVDSAKEKLNTKKPNYLTNYVPQKQRIISSIREDYSAKFSDPPSPFRKPRLYRSSLPTENSMTNTFDRFESINERQDRLQREALESLNKPIRQSKLRRPYSIGYPSTQELNSSFSPMPSHLSSTINSQDEISAIKKKRFSITNFRRSSISNTDTSNIPTKAKRLSSLVKKIVGY